MTEDEAITVATVLEVALEEHPDFQGTEVLCDHQLSYYVEIELRSTTTKLEGPVEAGAYVAALCGDWDE